MALMEWSDQLSVGVDMIDTDHRILVDQINMLHDSLQQGDDLRMIGSVLNVLIDYTAYHFDREKQLMETTGYAESDVHLREHRLLVKKVKEIQASFQHGQVLGQDVMTFLKVWLTQHILKSDKAFGAHLKASGAARMVPPPKLTGPVDWTRLSVLVVDDQFNFRLLLRNILNSIGISSVREARDGTEAFEMLSNEHFDVVLTDDEMKPTDGLNLARMIRTSSGSPDPRTLVILMPSQDITREYLQSATRAGVHDMIIKPIATNSVRARIEKHLTSPLPFQEINGMLIPVRQPPASKPARAVVGGR
jgi:hemerythrin-like metal-binding protein